MDDNFRREVENVFAKLREAVDKTTNMYREASALAGQALRSADDIVNALNEGEVMSEHMTYLVSEYIRHRMAIRHYLETDRGQQG